MLKLGPSLESNVCTRKFALEDFKVGVENLIPKFVFKGLEFQEVPKNLNFESKVGVKTKKCSLSIGLSNLQLRNSIVKNP